MRRPPYIVDHEAILTCIEANPNL